MSIDEQIFHWINTGWTSDVLDAVAPWLREAEHWIPLYLVIAAYMILRYRKRALPAIAAILLCFGLTDVISSRVLKPLVERPRPCHVMVEDAIELRVHCGSGYSFTSSHATNHFGFATILTMLLATGVSRRVLLGSASFLWAGSISLSQVYVGVHYPLDIVAGAVLGTILALLVHHIYITFTPSSWLMRPRLSV